MKLKRLVTPIISILLVVGLVFLTAGCSSAGRGYRGGSVNGVFHEGVSEKCLNASASAEGKVTEIDGIEIKFPVDYGYTLRNGGNYDGSNWTGDDAARGIGIFNCGEEGDESRSVDDKYYLNARWEYATYGSKEGRYDKHADYKGTDHTGQFEVGGTGLGVYTNGKWGGNGLADVDVDGYKSALRKAKIIVWNSEKNKACVAEVGTNNADHENSEINWGGQPLALMGGISKKLAETVEADQNKSVLELYWTDPSTPCGEISFSGGSSGGGTSSKKTGNCSTGSLNGGSIAECAVSFAWETQQKNDDGNDVWQKVRPAVWEGHDSNKGATIYWRCCDVTVATAIRWSGSDMSFPQYSTDSQWAYMDGSDKWQNLGVFGSDVQLSDLQPGDVLNKRGQHTAMFVGNDTVKKKYPNSDADDVSGSMNDRAPGCGHISSECSGGYNVFRLVKSDNDTTYKNI